MADTHRWAAAWVSLRSTHPTLALAMNVTKSGGTQVWNWWIGWLACLLAAQVQGASFNCEKAQTRVEKLICADVELSKADEELAAAYKAALQNEQQADVLRQAQKRWLTERNRCSDAVCVKRDYETRLTALTSSGAESAIKKPPFSLLKGKGVAVCEAYLKRLNATEWGDTEKMPTCGRPENDSVEGFAKLNRVPLSVEQITNLWGAKLDFLSQGNSERAHTTRGAPNTDKPTEEVHQSIQDAGLAVWRYEPTVDIDNDGKPDDDLIVWKGDLRQGICGRRVGATEWVSTHQIYIFFVDSQQMKLNEPRTRELTEHPLGGYSYISRIPGFFQGKRVISDQFRPIGIQMGIFAYQGQYYFDTFFDGWGDFEGKRRADFGDGKPRVKNSLADILGVFQRKNGVTKQICEYRWNEYEQYYR